MNHKHGHSGTPLEFMYSSMFSRCYNPKNNRYKNYGGRGITVCDEWLNSRLRFYNWAIDNGWKQGLQLDRIDNDGNYTPENCRLVTLKENTRTRGSNKLSEMRARHIVILRKIGKKKIEDIAWFYGINRCTVHRVLNGSTWA